MSSFAGWETEQITQETRVWPSNCPSSCQTAFHLQFLELTSIIQLFLKRKKSLITAVQKINMKASVQVWMFVSHSVYDNIYLQPALFWGFF